MHPPEAAGIDLLDHPGDPAVMGPGPDPEIISSRLGRAGKRWSKELALVGAFYALYTLVRDLHGESPTSVAVALNNAHHVISIERSLGVFREASVQAAFVHHRHFMEFWDGYYGTVHFLAVLGVLVFLFVRHPGRYRVWRNALAATTALALIGFAFFPLLPPRLLPVSFGFTDTLRSIGGLWDFSSGAVDEVSNQYAAMPSLHTGWSLWCALALLPYVRPLWARVAVCAYPVATVFCIVITANHYFVDAAGGVACLGIGYGVSRLLTTRFDRWWRPSPPQRRAVSRAQPVGAGLGR